jgi:hypothetical protein
MSSGEDCALHPLVHDPRRRRCHGAQVGFRADEHSLHAWLIVAALAASAMGAACDRQSGEKSSARRGRPDSRPAAHVGVYSYLRTTIGSTFVARRAGT